MPSPSSTEPFATSPAVRPSAAVGRLAWLLAAMATIGCGDPNQGVPPPEGGIFFPGGLLLDPRAPADEAARYLFVVNSNSDLTYNAGSVVAIDVEAFFDRWYDETYGVYPYCDGDRCVLDPGSVVDDAHPCRRLALLPQVVECDERPFVVDRVRIGDFATTPAATAPTDDSLARLFVPVRGDPSVTWMDVRSAPDSDHPLCGDQGPAHHLCPQLDCGQSGDEGRCGDDHRLTDFRNDEDLGPIEREPFNMIITETGGYRFGFVSHLEGGDISLIDLDGLPGDGAPAIVDSEPLFTDVSGVRSGAFGLATRPCSVEDGNAPNRTAGCTRPLVYGGFRYAQLLGHFVADRLSLPLHARRRDCRNPDDLCLASGVSECFADEPREIEAGEFLGPYCASPADLGEPCAVVCEPQLLEEAYFFPGGLDPSQSSRGVFGDLRFDSTGDRLYVLQTSPGALLEVDTSLDENGRVRNVPSRPPIEICEEPTRMQISGNFAYVSCFRAAAVFVIDLPSFRVVDTVVTGTGPHDLVVDPVREMLFVGNTLEASVSVIDLREGSRTRFKEIARIGLQEPFSQ